MKASELLSSLAALVDDEARAGTAGLGERVARRMAREWGGQNLYLPIDRARRARMIYEEFTGDNYSQIALRWRLAEPSIRRIVNRERKRRDFRQATLPGVL
jgi:Mor family transcriptional regulator